MPAEPRAHVTFRLGTGGRDWIKGLAATYQPRGGHSAVLRAALAVARRHEREVTALLKEQP